MEIDFNTEKLSYLGLVCAGTAVKEEKTDIIVPDTMEDAVNVISVQGTAYLRGKRADENGVTVAGVAEGCVLFTPESGNGISKADFSVPFEFIAAEGAVPESAELVANVTAQKLTAAIVNPRKLTVSVSVLAYAAAYVREEKEISLPSGTDENVQMKTQSESLRLVSAVNEKTFTVSDELALPGASSGEAEVLFVTTSAICEEVKGIGDKAVIRGRFVTDVVFTASPNATPEAARITSPFSQITEAGENGETGFNDITLAVTGTDWELITAGDGQSLINIDISAVAQCVTSAVTDLRWIADAYSNRYDLDITYDEIKLSAITGSCTATKSFAVAVDAPQAQSAVAVIIGNGKATADGKTVSADMYVTVLYVGESGEVQAASGTVRAQTECEMPAGDRAIAEAAWAGEVFTGTTPSGFEVRFPVTFTAYSVSNTRINAVKAISYDENTPKDNSDVPSVTVCRVSGDGELWELAKRFSSTEALIAEANNLAPGEMPEAGSIIIIPKER